MPHQSNGGCNNRTSNTNHPAPGYQETPIRHGVSPQPRHLTFQNIQVQAPVVIIITDQYQFRVDLGSTPPSRYGLRGARYLNSRVQPYQPRRIFNDENEPETSASGTGASVIQRNNNNSRTPRRIQDNNSRTPRRIEDIQVPNDQSTPPIVYEWLEQVINSPQDGF